MKKILMLLIISFSVISTYSHNEFYKVENFELVLTYTAPFVHWQDSQVPLALQFTTYTIPYELDYNETIAEFRNGYNVWASSSCYSFSEEYDGVECGFSTNSIIFPDPVNDGGMTTHAIEKILGVDYIVESTSFPQTFVYSSQVVFNNTVFKSFVWTNAIVFPPGYDWLHFKSVVCHELGHLLGLNHCSESEATMYYKVYVNTYDKSTLSSYDITGVTTLCGLTSIEDYIWINLTAQYYNVNQTYIGTNTRTFIDEFPYGDYIVEWGSWKVEAVRSCGKVLVFETQNESYINIPSLPDGYLWQRDDNGRVKAYISTSGIDNTGYNHYAEVPTAIGNVPNTFITSGTLTSNTNWRGCVTITGNINVPSGITLTIHPNSVITFLNNASLIVNGTLNASSCELNGGLNNWGSVTFSGSSASSSVLNNVFIKNGIGIRCLNGANVNIQNSIIYLCTEGVYIYNSQPQILSNQIIEPLQNGINCDASGLSPLILHNTIKKTSNNPKYHQYQGIILGNNTNGYIAHNDISGFMWGIYIGGGSDAHFSNYAHQVFKPNNRVRDNSIGIAAGWGGYIFAGMWKSYGRNNSIYNNSLDAKSYQHSGLYAEFNWWGTDGAQIYVDGTSTLDTDYPLASDPWNQVPSLGEEGINLTPFINNSLTEGAGFNPDSSVLIGVYLEVQERIVEAIQHYKQMIRTNNFPGFAIRRLAGIKNRYHIQNIRNYLENLLLGNQSFKPIVLTLFSGILLGEDKYDQAMLLLSKVINDYPGTYYAVNALFEKFFAALNHNNDRILAGQLLQELISLNLTEEEYLMRLAIAENLFNEGGTEYLGKSKTNYSENTESELPKEYNLLGNYPNPFNPSTTISYTLPYQSSVELTIYDIMGREVKSFSFASQPSGYQNIVWDGKNDNGVSVSSAVYLYRISIKSLENQEVFVKTSKLMLLK